MNSYDIEVKGLVEINADDANTAINNLYQQMQEKFPDLRWKTISISDSQEDKESLNIIQNLANENFELKLDIKNHNEHIEQMQAEMDQLRLMVYFQGNAVLNQLLEKVVRELRVEDRNSHFVRNAAIRKVLDLIQETNKEIDKNSTAIITKFINNQKIQELEHTIDHFRVLAENARKNCYTAEANTIGDMCDELLERIDWLKNN